MGKGDGRAKAKRNRQKFEAAMPKLAAIPKRKDQGKKRMDQIEQERQASGADRHVLETRARHLGERIRPEEKEDGEKDYRAMSFNTRQREKMRSAALCEPAGQALYISCGGREFDRRWQAYRGLTGSEAAYAKVSLGMRLHAKTAKIEMAPETFETRPDDRPDLRSEEERHRDAVNSWMMWQGRVMRLGNHEQRAIWDVVRDRVEPVEQVVGGPSRLTGPGQRFVDAMERLADVCEQRR